MSIHQVGEGFSFASLAPAEQKKAAGEIKYGYFPGTVLPPPDNINHPSHYTSHPSGVETITIVEHFDFVIGNIIKYAWRAGLKDGTPKMDDLKKCLWYARRAVEREAK